jgi:hypothetical protein
LSFHSHQKHLIICVQIILRYSIYFKAVIIAQARLNNKNV